MEFNQKQLNNSSATAAKILVKFFYYYIKSFNPEMFFINISHTGGPIQKKSQYEKFFDLEKFYRDPIDHFFLIRDPFNNTYNPAKNFKINDFDRKKLQRMFEHGLSKVLTKGEFFWSVVSFLIFRF